MEYITTEAVCKRLGISQDTALRWFKNGTMPAVKLGGRWFVKSSDLEAVMNGGNNGKQTNQLRHHAGTSHA